MRLLLGFLLITVSDMAIANAGLPMLAVVWPLSVPAIVPVIAIETYVVNRVLKVEWRHAFSQMAKANIYSTCIGIPLAWVASVALEFFLGIVVTKVMGSNSYPPEAAGEVAGVVLSAPWLGTISEGSHWILPVAIGVLLVPFFFASFWFEAWYLAPTLCPESQQSARRAIWNANLASYLALLGTCVISLAYGVATNG
jgi:hypothetical protein